MNNETAQIIIKLLEDLLSKPDGIVIAACITVIGMLVVAILTVIIQWRVTKTIIRSEHDRLRLQLKSEFQYRQFESWQKKFLDTISQLLKETDPEINTQFNPERVVPLIHIAQVMLNLEISSHRQVNDLITNLGLAVNAWETNHDKSSIMTLHGTLLEAVRKIINLPLLK